MKEGYLIYGISGFIFLVLGIFLTFKPTLTYEKESKSDIIAVFGIIFMIIGIILLLSPFLK
jgi:protein-S-isoprenylcysteine O-methyltransferase Ste14